MNGTQAIEFHRLLKKYKFTDQDANKFIEFVENRGGELATKKDLGLQIAPLKRDINWLKWILTSMLALMIFFWQDTKANISKLQAGTKAEVKSTNK